MDRKYFIKTLCISGSCSCLAIPLAAADKEKKEPVDKKVKELTKRLQFVQNRMAKLVDIMQGRMDQEALNKLLLDLGTQCAKEMDVLFKSYVNNLDGFLHRMEKSWHMKATHDRDKKMITVIGNKTGKCFCPFVDQYKMSSDFCNCSLGWQTQTFSRVIGKPVKARVLRSVLRGSQSCDFAIDYS